MNAISPALGFPAGTMAFEAALDRVLGLAPGLLAAETIDVSDGSGRILAEPFRAASDLPRHLPPASREVSMTPARTTLIVLVYSDSAAADRALRGTARRLEAAGCRLAGVVQRDDGRYDRAVCDMSLEEVSSGETIPISRGRGPHARGCRLDLGALLRAMQLVATALEQRPDVLILNKFGKTEAEGGGFRDLIAQAVEASVPVLIAVPYRNLDQWRAFAGDLAREVPVEGLDEAALATLLAAGQAVPDREGPGTGAMDPAA
ncbi:MAG: hypothetical protein JWO26_2788 [Rhodospirillales bacterium]|nr:hypothetical protein [Rhodospirillales bacterium]